MAQTQQLSQAAYDRLKEEHTNLTTTGRIDIARKIETARELGDLSENGDYHAPWKEKLNLLDKFEDERLVGFGKKIIFQESPETLPKSILNQIQREIARRILSEKKEKWWTCKELLDGHIICS